LSETLAYFAETSLTKKNSFKALTPSACTIKLFTAVIVAVF